MKRSFLLVGMLCLLAPFLFWGCSGDDGATGATGGTGPPGPPGPGVVSNEACIVCHGQNNEFQIANVHEFNPLTGVQNTCGTATITINSVTFGTPVGDNVPVTYAFTFKATSAAGADITSQIDLRTISPSTPPNANDNLAFVSFLLAKMPSATDTTTGSNEWAGFVVNPGTSGSSPFRANRPDGVDGAVFTGTPATGQYSYTFPTSAVRVSDGYVDNVVMRAGIQFSISGPINAGTSSTSINSATLNAAVLDLFTPNKKLQNTSDRRPVANAILDVVNPVGGGVGTAPTAAYPTKNDVTTKACNACHDILAIHGGGRRETQFCVLCHNAKLETAGNGASTYARSSLLNMGHRIHTSQDNLISGRDVVAARDIVFDAGEVTYPQAPLGPTGTRNCLTCHKGTDPYWKTRPTRYACGSCHTDVNFATGAGHGPSNIGGARPDDSVCALCHAPADIQKYHAAKDGAPPTPNNPYLMPGLAVFQYGIDTVMVDNTNAATVTFWIKKGVGLDNGDVGPLSYVNLLPGATDNVAKVPAGFSGSPSFLIAHSGSAANPQDYTNWDEPANTGGNSPSAATGQPKSVTLIGLPITATDNTKTKFQAKLTNSNSFPAGAKMRAVALQGYFTQLSVTGIDLNVDGVPDNVARHTPAVYQPVFVPSPTDPKVNIEAKRRVIAKSGYVNSKGVLVDDPTQIASLTPVGCLECHEAFEGHGGNRVNNVQVCVMCHNPQLTTSGRTIWDNVTIDPTVVAKLGSNPLVYPEVTQNMGEMMHGLHAGQGSDPSATSSTAAGLRQTDVRVNNFVIVRNRNVAPSGSPAVFGVYLDSAEITYPGDLTHCTKCHYAANPPSQTPVSATSQSYKADLPTGVLFTTEKVTTGTSGETLSQIIAARASFQGHDPSGNATDLVDSPIAAKCGKCHDTPAAVGHFLSTGGADITNTRSTAELTPAPFAPAVEVLGP